MYLSTYEAQQAGNAEQFRGMGVRWICFRLAFPPRDIADSQEREKTRENVTRRQKAGRGLA